MTPAIKQLQKARIPHQVVSYAHDPQSASYGAEAAEKLGLDPRQVFKTLLVKQPAGQLAVALVPVCATLDLKALGQVLGGKRVSMAEPAEAQRATGYLVGGISPLGQKKRLPTVIDQSAEALATLYVSAGRRGLEVALSPHDLKLQTGARFAPISR